MQITRIKIFVKIYVTLVGMNCDHALGDFESQCITILNSVFENIINLIILYEYKHHIVKIDNLQNWPYIIIKMTIYKQ
jgi:hypothetical protein